jgi:N-acetylmuramoyl-L-alanine amidase
MHLPDDQVPQRSAKSGSRAPLGNPARGHDGTAQETAVAQGYPHARKLAWSVIGLGLVVFLVALITFLGPVGPIGKGLVASASNAEAQALVSSPNARVSAISSQVKGAVTTVTIRLDKDIAHRLFALSEPSPRLVIDIPRVIWGLGNGTAGNLAGNGLVRQFRFAHKSSTESRIVLDLAGPVRVQKRELVNVLGGKAIRLELVAGDGATFANTAPPPTKIAASTLPTPAPVRPGPAGRRFVIVIDPGHGGKDPGAIGLSGLHQEKQITLASGLLLRDALRRDRRFQVVMTRETDVFLPLERRIVIARDVRADLFISLHADAAPPTAKVAGATVYTLSEEGGQRARRLLNNENWTIAAPNQTKDSAVVEILRDLTQRDTKNQSAVFGENLIKELRGVGPLTGSSHRRAGFFVLLSPRVPAVLLEMGFMTSADDEARLSDPAFRQRQMNATARAIGAYFDRVQVMAGTRESGR